MDRNLAPWQKRDGPMYLSEKRLLNRLVERGVSTPEDLAEDRFRENVIRLQCRLLARVGAVVEVAEDTFEATASGEAIFTEGVVLPGSLGKISSSMRNSVSLTGVSPTFRSWTRQTSSRLICSSSKIQRTTIESSMSRQHIPDERFSEPPIGN